MVLQEVFEVLYSPVKAFKKIIKKPDFKGVLLILVLVMFSMAVAQYVNASKLFLKTETPDDDDWTESISLWNSSKPLWLDDSDFKVGNYSIKSYVSNSTSVWMKRTDIGPFDCSEDRGYKELFFWIKWIHQNGTFPSSQATLRLFSDSESRYFELDLTNLISDSSDKWSNSTVNNATLKIGPENKDWAQNNSPDWKSVTGLEFRLAWLTSANLTMKTDDLHFRKYVPLPEKGAFSGLMISTLIYAAIDFSMNWIIWAGILFFTLRAFGEKGGPWTNFFIIIGHVFSLVVVYWLASAALFSTLPTLNLPVKTLPATTEKGADAVNALIEERWYPHWSYQLSFLYLPFVREIWTMALCAISIRFLCKISWKKAVAVSVIAFVVRFALRFILGF